MIHQKVKIFGERNTSTNALKKVIEINSNSTVWPSVASELVAGFKIRSYLKTVTTRSSIQYERWLDRAFANVSASHAWKHCAPNFDDLVTLKDTLVVFCVRHPASWLLSLHRRPYNALQDVPEDFETFLTSKWKTLSRDQLAEVTLTPVQLYNQKLQSYQNCMQSLAASNYKYHIVKFEDFAVDQEQVFNALKGSLMDKHEPFKILEKNAKQDSRNVDYFKNYYGKELWRQKISDTAMRIIDEGIDWNIVQEQNYLPSTK